MTRIVLASTSHARSRLLRDAGVDFDVRAPGVDEAAVKRGLIDQGATPREIADALAQAKAVKISLRTDGLVLGCDQTLDLDGRLFDKPANLTEARDHLLALRGSTHRLHSAVVAAAGGSPVWREVSTATLVMRAFTDDFLEAYLATEGESLLACAGAYRLEGRGVQLFDQVQGDYFAILGLPMTPLLAFLRMAGCIAS
jgi:septum formation protein